MTEDLLFLLVRLGLGNSSARDESCEALSSLDAAGWKALIDLAFEQGMASIAVDGLGFAHDNDNQEGLDLLDSPELEDLKYEWFGSVFQDEQDNSDQISVLKDMASRWAQEVLTMLEGSRKKLYAISDGFRANLHPLTPSIRSRWMLIDLDSADEMEKKRREEIEKAKEKMKAEKESKKRKTEDSPKNDSPLEAGVSAEQGFISVTDDEELTIREDEPITEDNDKRKAS